MKYQVQWRAMGIYYGQFWVANSEELKERSENQIQTILKRMQTSLIEYFLMDDKHHVLGTIIFHFHKRLTESTSRRRFKCSIGLPPHVYATQRKVGRFSDACAFCISLFLCVVNELLEFINHIQLHRQPCFHPTRSASFSMYSWPRPARPAPTGAVRNGTIRCRSSAGRETPAACPSTGSPRGSRRLRANREVGRNDRG